jgi:hypothetical membrane protein
MDTQGVETATGNQKHVRELRQARRLAALVIVGIVLYVVLDVVAQVLTHQNAISQAESDLATNPSYGTIMRLNFVVRGLVALALIAALHKTLSPAAHSRVGAILLEVWGVGAFILAIFDTDVPPHHTIHGLIHLVVAFIAFIAGAVGELLISLRLGRDPAWATLRLPLVAIAILALLTLVVQIPATNSAASGTGGIFGLVERIFIGLVLLWMLVVALRILGMRTPATA